MSISENKNKLILSISILGIIFTIFTFSLLNLKYSEYQALSNLEEKIILSTNLSKLVHELQKERGLSIAFTSNKGKRFEEELKLQRINTDYKINLFIKQNKKMVIHKYKLLEKININREKIDLLELSLEEIKKYYTNINSTFLNTIISISKTSDLSIITRSIIAYSNFLLSKEYAGLERAIGTTIISNKNFLQNNINIFNTLITKQKIYTEIFFKYTVPNVKQYYKVLLKTSSINDVDKIRKVILNSNEIEISKLDVNIWFKQTSLRIEKLKEVDDYLAKNILKTINHELKTIKSDFISFSLLNFIMFIVSIVMFLIIFNLLKKEKEQRLLIDKYVITSATDLQGRIKDVSKAFCDVSGYTRSELIGQQHNIVRHKDMPKEAFKDMWIKIKNNETWQGKVKNKKKEGGYYWVSANISPIYSYGKKVGYSSIRQDITNNVKIEELNNTLKDKVSLEVEKNREKDKQIIQQSRLAQMGEMISMIAHQWRQPLAAISSLGNGLNIKAQLGTIDNETIIKLSKDITDNSQHLSSTIDDFREFFRPNKEKRACTFNQILANVLNIVEAMITNNNITIIKNMEDENSFNSYPNELKQVVLNLLKNAEDALLDNKIENPFIKISCYTKDNNCILKISDNAGGIPENILVNIFDPYFSTKTKKDGTGLGLYMSKTIIEDHCKGILEVKNIEDGATFKISLPFK